MFFFSYDPFYNIVFLNYNKKSVYDKLFILYRYFYFVLFFCSKIYFIL